MLVLLLVSVPLIAVHEPPFGPVGLAISTGLGRRRGAVLLVGDVLAPADRTAVVVDLLHRKSPGPVAVSMLVLMICMGASVALRAPGQLAGSVSR